VINDEWIIGPYQVADNQVDRQFEFGLLEAVMTPKHFGCDVSNAMTGGPVWGSLATNR